MQDFTTVEFQALNRGYDRVFKVGRMTIGLVVPIEHDDSGPTPMMTQHGARVHSTSDTTWDSTN